MLLLADPRVAAVPVRESGEILVDLRATTIRLDERHRDEWGGYAHVRRSVQDRLHRAQSALPAGVQLLVAEGWRHPAIQRQLFESYAAKVREAEPELDDAGVRAATSAYIAPPEVAPHTTGGAVDLTLCDANGAELDMGTALNATPLESNNLCYTDAADLEPEARRNRGLLVSTMARAGFVNYPTEWWHWSYGDRYWAISTREPVAIFGAIEYSAASS